MPTEFCLKATDEAALAAALPFARGVDREGNPCWIGGGHRFALDVIGELALTQPVVSVSEDGVMTVVTPAVMAEGYHANIQVYDDEIAALIPDSIKIYPANPRRVFWK